MANQKIKNIIIIGGGASGMIAAIAAARAGARVTILERTNRVGKKLLATGNGRCNLTNSDIDISRYHGKHPEFVYGTFSRFDYNSTIGFFEELGITPRIEDGGKVFPMSLQASSVLDVLRYEIEELKIEVICDSEVAAVERNKQFKVILKDGRNYRCDAVVLAAGGKSSPDLGSNGSGYELAMKLGHKIIEPFPALVQLKLIGGFLKQVQGVKFDGDVEVIVDNKALRKETGEILFTEYGISGPPVLQVSRKAIEALQKDKKVLLKVSVINTMSFDELDSLIQQRIQSGPSKPLDFSFIGLLNKKLIPVVLKEAKVDDINKPSRNLSNDERKRIVALLKDWRFEVTGAFSWVSSQVTAGGIDVKDIDNKTMESKLIKGLYFSGEIVDIDGDCGGYNLQWAWSSGYVAGENAAKGD